MTNLIALIGEQPMPILLPAKYLQPEGTILVHTTRTSLVAQRLQRLIPNSVCVATAAYELADVFRQLEEATKNLSDLLINLTGGTKIMSLAAYALAAQRQCDFLYVESEGKATQLFRYQLREGIPLLVEKHPLPTVITADAYLLAHLPGYTVEGFSKDETGRLTIGGRFEQAIYQALQPHVDELLPGVRPAGVARQIEMDLVIRIGNHVGIAELKYGRNEDGPKRGIDQLSTATNREYLGIYTHKFMITSRRLPRAIHTLAQEKGVMLIELTRYANGQVLPDTDVIQLIQMVKSVMAQV